MAQSILESMEELDQQKREFFEKVVSSETTVGTAKEIKFQDAVTLYGGYATPLLHRLAHTKSLSITHYWTEIPVRASHAQVNAEGGAFHDTTSSVYGATPARKSNTCQICSGLIEISGSALQEAANGIYGPGMDFAQLQAEAEIQGILKDIEVAIVANAAEVTTPGSRAMGSLKSVLTTSAFNAGSAVLGTATIGSAIANIMTNCPGQVPNAIYAGYTVLEAMAGWSASKVQFVFDVANLRQMAEAGDFRIAAGQAIGWYFSQAGPLALLWLPDLAYSLTAASNFLYIVNESLIRIADLRPLTVTPLAQTADKKAYGVLWEGTLEAKVEKAHAKVHNWTV